MKKIININIFFQLKYYFNIKFIKSTFYKQISVYFLKNITNIYKGNQ